MSVKADITRLPALRRRLFLASIDGHVLSRYSDGGALLKSGRTAEALRRKRKAQRQARKTSRS